MAVDPATGAIATTATVSTAGLATSTNQTNGSQKTQIVETGFSGTASWSGTLKASGIIGAFTAAATPTSLSSTLMMMGV